MDMHTLHIEHAVLLGLYTILTLVNSWLHRGTKGVHWFPVYNFCAFLGATLIALRGHIPNSLSIVAGDLCFTFAYLFLHRSLTEFFDKGAYQWRVQLVLIVICSYFLMEYGFFHPNTKNRLVAYSLVLTCQLGVSAYFVFRNLARPTLISGSLLGLVLAVLSFNTLFRALGIALFGSPENYLSGGLLLSGTLLVTSVLQGGVTVAFVWMTAALLRYDLQLQASTDSLTGLLNRRAVEALAAQEIATSQQSRQPLCAILIDLDGFKQINDSFGHNYGDAALIAVARCLQHGLRKRDRLARIGGDEFAILLPNTALETTIEIAERLRTTLEQFEVVHGQTETRIRASFGVAQLQTATPDWQHLIMRCDKALYQVKGVGGNLVVSR